MTTSFKRWLATVLALCATRCAHAPSARIPSEPEAPQSSLVEAPSRADVLAALRPADEFVRRCTQGPHRVFAIATVLFHSDGTALDANIDTGDPAANECARRLLLLQRVSPFRSTSFTVSYPFRVYSDKQERVRTVPGAGDAQMEFAPELCLWGASGDPRCRDEREANAVDCPVNG